jgi:Trk K+ transport system NAD-binding subunit/mannitol/fructose-specific phosphotransferase system IIA component (Ntr-type)/Kef-type K+ transport system membrane component KefB
MDLIAFVAAFTLIALASRQMGHSLMNTGLPLISGFLFTGILAGPYMLNLISSEAVSSLRFIDEMSLGFIAFSAGGELYIKELRTRVKSIAWVTAGLVLCTFSLTSVTLFALSGYIPFMSELSAAARVAVCILAGAILVARSPSSAIAIVNELRAKGPFTQTVLGVTIIMDVVVIVLFSINSSMADALLTGLALNLGVVFLLLGEIGASVILGFLISKWLLTLLVLNLHRLVKTVLILTTGWLVFLMSAALRQYTHDHFAVEILLEPLLICMVAGFLMANTSRFRKEFLTILYEVGPPVYIAFFTLTGASLSLSVLYQTWPIALALFFARMTAIFTGSFIGGTLAGNPLKMNAVSGMAFITQAGVGLGLAKEVVVEFPQFGNALATIIIAVIVLNQIAGPPLFKLAIKLMKEDHPKSAGSPVEGVKEVVIFGSDGQSSALALSLKSQGWRVSLAVPGQGSVADETADIRVHRLSGLTVEELRRINSHKAGALVAMLSDEHNYSICETAYEHFGTRTLIARLNDRINFARFQALGVLIVDPSTAIVGLLDHFVRSPAAASLLMGMHKERKIVDMRIQNPGLAGLALRDLRLPFDAIIMSVRRRGVLFVPHGFTRLETGDLVTVMGSEKSIKELALRFGVNQKDAMLHLVEQAAARQLEAKVSQQEVKQILSGGPTAQKDRFDILVEKAQVMDIKQRMNRDMFFDMVAHTMSESLQMSSSAIFDLLVKREEEATTVLAPGLAVPHIIVEGEKRFSILLARCKQGIEFSPDQPLVNAAFVLIGSRDERKFHLQALSAIAQIVLDPRFENKWMRARNRSALKNVVAMADRKREMTA